MENQPLANLVVSALVPAVTGLFAAWIAWMRTKDRRAIADRTAEGAQADRLASRLWEIVHHAEEKRDAAERECQEERERRQHYEDECVKLRQALHVIGLDNRLSDIQTTVTARRICEEWPKHQRHVADLERFVESLRRENEALREELATRPRQLPERADGGAWPPEEG